MGDQLPYMVLPLLTYLVSPTIWAIPQKKQAAVLRCKSDTPLVLANSQGMKRAVVVDKELYNLPDMRRADRVCKLSQTLLYVGFHS